MLKKTTSIEFYKYISAESIEMFIMNCFRVKINDNPIILKDII